MKYKEYSEEKINNKNEAIEKYFNDEEEGVSIAIEIIIGFMLENAKCEIDANYGASIKGVNKIEELGEMPFTFSIGRRAEIVNDIIEEYEKRKNSKINKIIN
ncbi:MAG: hypothetical protein ACRCZ0_05690 [Cetobacterium sp.]